MEATSEIGAGGVVEMLAVREPVRPAVLLYKGEELVGAKKDRILEQTILVAAGATLKILAQCTDPDRIQHAEANTGHAWAAGRHALEVARISASTAKTCRVPGKPFNERTPRSAITIPA